MKLSGVSTRYLNFIYFVVVKISSIQSSIGHGDKRLFHLKVGFFPHVLVQSWNCCLFRTKERYKNIDTASYSLRGLFFMLILLDKALSENDQRN